MHIPQVGLSFHFVLHFHLNIFYRFPSPFCSDSVGGLVAGLIALVIIIVVVSVVVRAKHRQSVVMPISSGGAHISTVNTSINTNIHGEYLLKNKIHNCLDCL